MQKRSQAILTGLLVLSLGGCVIHVSDDGVSRDEDWKERQAYNREVISRLDLGLTRAEVRERLGEPDYSEAYVQEGVEYHILHYRTQHRHSDGETTRDETTPLVFRNGHLEGWGETQYAKVTRSAEP